MVNRKNNFFKIALFFVASIATSFFSCNNGNSTNNNRPEQEKKLIVKFASNITCKNNGVAVVSGATVKVGDKLAFVAIPETNKVVDSWYINSKKIDGQSDVNFAYTVKLEDAKDEINAKVFNVHFEEKTKDADKIIIRFGNNIKCTENGGVKPITSESEVHENQVLNFFTAQLASGKAVKNWRVNDRKLDSENKNIFDYTVSKNDIIEKDGKKVIEISFEEKDVEKLFIRFGSSITCEKTEGALSNSIDSETEVKEGDELTFTATLSNNKVIEGWYINNEKVENATETTFEYAVKGDKAKVEGDKKIIEVSFKDKDAEMIRIKFDSSKIECKKDGTDPFTADTDVQEGTNLLFTAKLEAGKLLEGWFINDNQQPNKNAVTFSYTVKVSDAKLESSQKVINVRFTDKDAVKMTLKFDSNQIECKKDATTSIMPDTEVYEGDNLLFTAKLQAGKVIEDWLINDKKANYGSIENFNYTVKVSDGKDVSGKKTVTVAIKLKD
ncbi:MAG: InlB B-repeat-containing protein [Treponema sp.]